MVAWTPRFSQMKALKDENRRLKKMYAEMSMQAELLKEGFGEKITRPSQRREPYGIASIAYRPMEWPGKQWRYTG